MFLVANNNNTSGRRYGSREQLRRQLRRSASCCFSICLTAALGFGISGCGSSVPSIPNTQDSSEAIVVVDGLGDTLILPRPARRIVSLMASGTESLLELGAAEYLVGRTVYDKAAEIEHVQLVGTGLEPNLETLLSLKPDLIVGWAAERRQKLHARLRDANIKVYNLATQDTSDIFKGISDLSRMIGRDTAGVRLLAQIRGELDEVREAVSALERRRVLYVVSLEPPITANARTYVSQVIEVAGGDILFPNTKQNWPTVSLEEIAIRDPEYIILPVGEFKMNAIERMRSMNGWKDLKAVRNNNVITIEADLINRPGPHIADIARQIRDSIYQRDQ